MVLSLVNYSHANTIAFPVRKLFYKVLISLSTDFCFVTWYCYRMDSWVQIFALHWVLVPCSLEEQLNLSIITYRASHQAHATLLQTLTEQMLFTQEETVSKYIIDFQLYCKCKKWQEQNLPNTKAHTVLYITSTDGNSSLKERDSKINVQLYYGFTHVFYIHWTTAWL